MSSAYLTRDARARAYIACRAAHIHYIHLHPLCRTARAPVVSGQRSAPRLAPDEPSYAADYERDELKWYSVEEVAQLCRRSPSTIKGLISKHQLRRRMAWRTIGRRRQRLMLLSPNVARWCQRVTLFRETAYLEHPPT
jgi:hypothetical protein